MTEPLCAHCTKRPSPDTTICRHCTKTLDVALANIRAYYDDLDTIRTRQARYGDPTPTRGSTGREMPLPVDLRFTDPDGRGADLAWVARNTIIGWVRIVAGQWPPFPYVDGWSGPVCDDCLHRSCNQRRLRTVEHKLRRLPADTLPSCCAYLHRFLFRIAGAEWAAEMLDELLDLERRLRRFVDRPVERWYAGPCTAGMRALEATWFCGAELYAELGKPDVVCPNRDCGTRYDVAERRTWLLAAAEDRLENAVTIARAVLVLGQADSTETQLAGRIRQWARRRRIVARADRTLEGKTQPLYRVGDVLDLLAEDARHAAEKAG